MQLQLAVDDRAETLAEINRRLLRCFGAQGPFEQLDPVTQLVLGLVGGRTREEVSKHACIALWARFGDWETVRDAPVEEILEIIGAVTFADNKARRLKTALALITRECGALTLDHLDGLSVAEAVRWLERLPGVGRKVAAATLNFSCLRKPALVIDSHHLRVLKRLGLVGRRANFVQAYEAVMPLFAGGWSADDLDQQHQLMKTLGQTVCRYDAPDCRRCPLRGLCPTAV